MHCTDVPYLGWLHGAAHTITKSPTADAETDNGCLMRPAWKTYLSSVFPHARRQITNFMLACIAEGKSYDMEEDTYRRSTALICDVSLADIANIMSFQKRSEVHALSSGPSNEDA
eukprot:1480283-Karenia_brevis.AAC.1